MDKQTQTISLFEQTKPASLTYANTQNTDIQYNNQQFKDTNCMDPFLIIKDYRTLYSGQKQGTKMSQRMLDRNGCLKPSFFWTSEEHEIYVKFLQQNQEQVEKQSHRRSKRVFCKISALLGTRTPIQVKSHHQKMIKRWKSVKKIIFFSSRRSKMRSKLPEDELKSKNPIEQKNLSINNLVKKFEIQKQHREKLKIDINPTQVQTQPKQEEEVSQIDVVMKPTANNYMNLQAFQDGGWYAQNYNYAAWQNWQYSLMMQSQSYVLPYCYPYKYGSINSQGTK